MGSGSAAILRTGGGTLSVSASLSLYVGNLTLSPGDSIAQLFIYNNSALTTGAINNVTGQVTVSSGTLTLGSNFNLPNLLYVDGTLNAAGHTITANEVLLGEYGPFVLVNLGPIVTPYLSISSRYVPSLTSFTLTPADNVGLLYLYGVNTTFQPGVAVPTLHLSSNGASPPTFASATTTQSSNLTADIYVDPSCMLTLGADLSLSSSLYLNGTLNANNHAVSLAISAHLNGQAAFVNDGLVNVFSWYEANGAHVQLHHSGDALHSILLSGASSLALTDATGQLTGLTLTGSFQSDMSIAAGSQLSLEMNALASGWVFRWANHAGSNHIADLQNLINAGEITFTSLNGGGYSLSADSSYTYVNVTSVPEPSTLLLTAAAAGFIALRRWKI
jgi:hypothetical protein